MTHTFTAYKRELHETPELKSKLQHRKQLLYGKEAAKVHSWEMALDQIYDHVTNLKAPPIWPHTPLNLF